MNKTLLVALIALFAPVAAHAYQDQGGAPGKVQDARFKPVIKSAVAGVSDAVASAGEILSYSAVNDGYTVTRVGDGTVLGSGVIACVARDTIATGDVAAHLCQVDGYAEVMYDASSLEFARGENLCVNSVGKAVNCAAAGSKSIITSLENRARGTTGSIKVLVNSR